MARRKEITNRGADIPSPCCACTKFGGGAAWTIKYIPWRGRWIERIMHTGQCERDFDAKINPILDKENKANG